MRVSCLAAALGFFWASIAAAQTSPEPPIAVAPMAAPEDETPEQIAQRHAALLDRYGAALAVCQAVMAGEAAVDAATRHGFSSSEPMRVGAMTLREIRLAEANHLGMDAMVRRSEEVALQARLRIFAAENAPRCLVRATGPVDFLARAEEFAAGWTRVSDERGPDPESPQAHVIWRLAFTDAAGSPVAFSGRRSFQGFGNMLVLFGESAEAMQPPAAED